MSTTSSLGQHSFFQSAACIFCGVSGEFLCIFLSFSFDFLSLSPKNSIFLYLPLFSFIFLQCFFLSLSFPFTSFDLLSFSFHFLSSSRHTPLFPKQFTVEFSLRKNGWPRSRSLSAVFPKQFTVGFSLRRKGAGHDMFWARARSLSAMCPT